MSNNRFVFTGLEELKRDLRALPEDLRDDAAAIMDDTADAAVADIGGNYPERTGNLRKGMRKKVQSANARFGYAVAVINVAQHALIFERGTGTRKTKTGANRGSMAPGKNFIPRMAAHRKRMYERLKHLVESKGDFVVTDDGGR